MINLDVREYCQQCPSFEADVDRAVTRDFFDNITMCETTVRCKNRDKCEQMYEHMLRTVCKEESKDGV